MRSRWVRILSTTRSAQAEEIEQLLTEHLVLFFSEQFLTREEHTRFAQHFGELAGHPNLNNPFADTPEIFELSASRGGIADEWHSDITFQPEPSVMAILNMVQCPEVGGDTLWANMYKAYDELSPPLRDLCQGLTALHDADPHGKSRPDDRAPNCPCAPHHPAQVTFCQ